LPGQTEAQFLLAGGMSQRSRVWTIVVLLLAGLLIQLMVSVSIGAVIFLIGCLFGAVRGKKVQPEITGRGDWQTTTMEGLQTVSAMRSRIDRWGSRTGVFNPSRPKGFCCLFLMLVAGFIGTLLIAFSVDGAAVPGSPASRIETPFIQGGPLWPVWAVDMAILILIVWFSGQISVWQPDELIMKIDQLLYIARQASKDPTLEVVPSLQTVKGEKGDVPTDARLLVKLKGAPEDFVGIQVQTSLNSVQGTKYPYTYCVILARQTFGLGDKLARHISGRREGQFRGRIVEVEREKDMDVAVVRQITSRGGYRTSEAQAAAIFQTALELARLAIG